MKITWFGASAIRLYYGGRIVVLDADLAPSTVDRGEVRAGADVEVSLGDETLPEVDPTRWRPPVARRAIDEPDEIAIQLNRLGPSSLLIASPGEPPLVVLGEGAMPEFGRWADGAVIVLLGGSEALVAAATVILDVARPRVIAIAADEQALDTAVDEIAEHLDGAGLVSLEPGLALEV